MKNPIATTNNGALTSIALAMNGIILYPMITLLRYPLVALLALRAAAITARDNYENGKPVLKGLRDAMNVARLEARTFLFLVREILKPILGTEYSELWNAIGLFGSLEMPQNVDELILLLEAVVAYLTVNPAVGAARNLTAADAQAVLDALKDARKAVIDQEDAMTNLLTIRDQKFAAVRKGLRGVFHELEDILDPLDPRWKAFGFNMPGADETPDVPTDIHAILIGPNAAAAKWGASARASHYRVWRRIIGVDAEPVTVGSPADLDFTLENLPAASTVEIYISAVNNGGESQLSEKITIVTH
ncbi:MAG: hypothetical protein JWM68_4262 [Verrucomicrobiales bacterium]|nr:hypothetical protein [Verrucomicrobiales bacterium]